ncbi:phosphate ABC transporter substrate-binding protein [bacterium]|nr:phosphate ABC transporter substrate-binding protein [bacterium]
MNQRKIIVTLVALLMLAPLAVQAGVVVIANDSVPATSLSAGDLQSIFLGRQSSWSDGSAISPAVLGGGPVAEEFLKTYVKKSPSQFQAFWKKALFTGTGTPPEEVGSDAAMLEYVAATAGAIGFISDATAADGVEVLTVE